MLARLSVVCFETLPNVLPPLSPFHIDLFIEGHRLVTPYCTDVEKIGSAVSRSRMTETLSLPPATLPVLQLDVDFTYTAELPDDLICKICLAPWVQPIEVRPCGHIFCRECCSRLLQPTTRESQGPVCAECRQKIEALQQPHRALRNLVDALPARCLRCNACSTRAQLVYHDCLLKSEFVAALEWGECLLNTGRFVEAEKEFSRAIDAIGRIPKSRDRRKKSKIDAQLHKGRAASYFERQQHDLCIQDATQALEKETENITLQVHCTCLRFLAAVHKREASRNLEAASSGSNSEVLALSTDARVLLANFDKLSANDGPELTLRESANGSRYGQLLRQALPIARAFLQSNQEIPLPDSMCDARSCTTTASLTGVAVATELSSIAEMTASSPKKIFSMWSRLVNISSDVALLWTRDGVDLSQYWCIAATNLAECGAEIRCQLASDDFRSALVRVVRADSTLSDAVGCSFCELLILLSVDTRARTMLLHPSVVNVLQYIVAANALGGDDNMRTTCYAAIGSIVIAEPVTVEDYSLLAQAQLAFATPQLHDHFVHNEAQIASSEAVLSWVAIVLARLTLTLDASNLRPGINASAPFNFRTKNIICLILALIQSDACTAQWARWLLAAASNFEDFTESSSSPSPQMATQEEEPLLNFDFHGCIWRVIRVAAERWGNDTVGQHLLRVMRSTLLPKEAVVGIQEGPQSVISVLPEDWCLVLSALIKIDPQKMTDDDTDTFMGAVAAMLSTKSSKVFEALLATDEFMNHVVHLIFPGDGLRSLPDKLVMSASRCFELLALWLAEQRTTTKNRVMLEESRQTRDILLRLCACASTGAIAVYPLRAIDSMFSAAMRAQRRLQLLYGTAIFHDTFVDLCSKVMLPSTSMDDRSLGASLMATILCAVVAECPSNQRLMGTERLRDSLMVIVQGCCDGIACINVMIPVCRVISKLVARCPENKKLFGVMLVRDTMAMASQQHSKLPVDVIQAVASCLCGVVAGAPQNKELFGVVKMRDAIVRWATASWSDESAMWLCMLVDALITGEHEHNLALFACDASFRDALCSLCNAFASLHGIQVFCSTTNKLVNKHPGVFGASCSFSGSVLSLADRVWNVATLRAWLGTLDVLASKCGVSCFDTSQLVCAVIAVDNALSSGHMLPLCDAVLSLVRKIVVGDPVHEKYFADDPRCCTCILKMSRTPESKCIAQELLSIVEARKKTTPSGSYC